MNAEWKRVFGHRIKKGAKGCIIWTAGKVPQKYGKVRYHGKDYYAHRLSYELTYGKPMSGMLIRHRCDVPDCVNPRHLHAGTHGDNMKDLADCRRRRKTPKRVNHDEILALYDAAPVGKNGNRKVPHTLTGIAKILGCSPRTVSGVVRRYRGPHEPPRFPEGVNPA